MKTSKSLERDIEQALAIVPVDTRDPLVCLLRNTLKQAYVDLPAIQHDARQQGYTEAAEIVANNWNGHASNYCELIEAARNNLKLP